MVDFPMTTVITKQIDLKNISIPVTYYPLFVTKELADWPERKQRERRWTPIEDFADIDYPADFEPLLTQFVALSPWILTAVEKKKPSK